MNTVFRQRPWLAILLASVIVAVIYAPGFTGFWHGDDIANLGRVYTQSQQGSLWREALSLFAAPVPSAGAFYRPMMMLSMSVNFFLFDAYYPGWYLFNFLVHIANTLLVAMVVRRIAAWAALDASLAAVVAALLFGLSPVIAEGVYWVSARADGWVTLLSLTGIYLWAGPPGKEKSSAAFALPLLLVVALGFKESAAVLPLQMTLLALAWPVRLNWPMRAALAGAFLVVVLFLLWRAHLFGNAWQVYAADTVNNMTMSMKLLHALQSIPAWWLALTGSTPTTAGAYLIAIALITIAAPAMARNQLFLALAFLFACGGLVLATLLNLGGLNPNGEGGRLSYGPVAWLALAIGIFLSRPLTLMESPSRSRSVALASAILAILVGATVLWAQLSVAWYAQDGMRALTTAMRTWPETHPGLTMLIVPENDGAIVLTRNAQGGMALVPIQPAPQLHRVLPTLQSELALRRDQFCNGLVTRLELIQPRVGDEATLKALVQPAETRWPAHIACWSKAEKRIVALSVPSANTSCNAWLEPVTRQVNERCDR